jgi:spore germination cell wall hydrolase CwlJ-like protein
MLGAMGALVRDLRTSLHFSVATVAYGFNGPLNVLLSEGGHLWTKLRAFAAQTGLSRMVEIVVDIETRRLAVKAVAGLGVMAVVAVGMPQLEQQAKRQAEDYAWRMKARAFAQFDAEASAATAPAVSRLAALHSVEDAANDRAAVAPFQTFAPVHFKTAEEQNVDLDCLSRAIYYEARSESVRGQLAVAEVVLNRVAHRLYPNNVCGVVYEGTDRDTGLSWRGNHQSCQFSFTCDGSEDRRPPQGQHWAQAQRIAAHAMMGLSSSVTGDATHYHANYVSPHWAPRLVHTQTIGTHIFYRFPSGNDEGPRRGA